jgi:DNA-binding transcriptional ArsR family regulator
VSSQGESELDIRKLIRQEISRQGWSEAEASREAGQHACTMRQVLEGSRSLSGKLLNAMISKWGIHKRPALLQRWLLAFLVDRLEPKGGRWLSRAGFELQPLRGAEGGEGQDFMPYAVLADTGLAARRRLAVLRRLAEGSGGVEVSELCSAGWDTRAVIGTDLDYLERQGYVASQMRTASYAHPLPGQEHTVRRKGKQRLWRLTEVGEALVRRTVGLPDLSEEDKGLK